MTQINTYGTGKVTEADKRAAAERAREAQQIAEAERLDTAVAGADAEAAKLIAEDILRREEKRVPPPEPGSQAEAAEREEDEARLAKLIVQDKRNTKTFYSGMKMAMGAALKASPRSVEAGLLCGKHGWNNPLAEGLMGISDAVGVPQDKLKYQEALLEKFARLLHGNNGTIDKDYFENPRSWM
ncbi:hypothetical protein LCGC14_0765020 [marine sediment metagenome]|uniref:Uncharacterized protein n=1 Tax=marine sediment metagenome TaxID=412755 RepID=A0A0F9T751_9ZZZZ